ncbi:NUDIX hydrolase N-terminal domain-containing protein [Bacillus sp. NTK071]|uniref:NUDIX hydrolase n=1 Tax=Bacillus sp. NTK071 TaxID=2802175 RepID=UPI001A8C1864|nr:NUDIX hydrolase N-terminal domain-containing protein [Bacillus sp. NTK071]MBN8209683.1 NUDIX hydrolase N-terminal domain-containing protein [Bacillus sp. NTK071]
MEEKWLAWAKQIQSIAQAGLTYTRDDYDYERYIELRQLSAEILETYTEYDMKTIQELFTNETGYQTPKVDIRAAVIKDGKILLVKEKADGKWSIPGGWGDVGFSPAEVAVKEVEEESGYLVEAKRLLAVLDHKHHPHPPSPYHIYKMIIGCELVGGNATDSIETSDCDFFSLDNLPPLSDGRITESQITMLFRLHDNPSMPTVFD